LIGLPLCTQRNFSGYRFFGRRLIAMAKKTHRGVSRGRRLTPAEAAKIRALRQQVERELPPAKAVALKVAIAKLRALREASACRTSPRGQA
jgi:hypothetical protein